MTVTVKKGMASGTVKAPPSKSVAHRALICSALSGHGKVSNIEYSDDIRATVSCLKSLGADITELEDSVIINSFDPEKVKDGTELYCFESGSTLRFMIPLCLMTGKKITLSGSKRLFERPLKIYEDIALKNGFLFEKDCSSLTVCGNLSYGEYTLPGDISSQFISGLLFALPLAKRDSRIVLTGKTESRSYILLTLSVLEEFGINAVFKGNTIQIEGSQRYTSRDYTVEGDCSNAAFLDALGFVGGDVTVTGIKENTVQGDRVYKEMFSKLKNGERSFDLSDCPDLAPIMFALAAASGGARFEGTRRLKIKESDRAQAMHDELLKFGTDSEIYENSVVIRESELKAPSEILQSHNDHRIAMSLAVLCTLTGGTISGAQAVNKSYPAFFKTLNYLKIGTDTDEA